MTLETPMGVSRYVYVCLALGLTAAGVLPAQEITASITGTVSDPSGTIIAGAAVTATDMQRGTAASTRTNNAGIYVFPRIPAGNYEIVVEFTGFRKAVRSGIDLELNQRVRVDIRLEIGQVSEVVEVTGDAPCWRPIRPSSAQ